MKLNCLAGLSNGLGNSISFLRYRVGLLAYSVENYYLKNREIETREYRIRRTQYERLVKILVLSLHKIKTRNELTTIEDKLEMDYATNLLYLYASSNVLRALNNYIDEKQNLEAKNKYFQELIDSMRKDLNINDDLKKNEIFFFIAN